MIQKLRRFLHLESTEEALRDFALVIEQSELLKSEIDLMAREYLNSTKELDTWQKAEKGPEVQELIKAQQDGLTSRYLNFLSGKKQEYNKLEESKKSYIAKHPDFEKALVDLKRNDFIESNLTSYRSGQLTLEECDTFIKAITKNKVRYSDNIVFNQNGELLIAQRQPLGSLKDGANLWVLPGGHVNLGEPCIAAAKRELLEETGYEVDDLYFVGDFDEGDVHIEYFMSMIDDREQSPTVDAEETRATAFIPVNDLYKYPTQFMNMWDNVYRILGIESVVPIKKAVAEGLVKASEVADAKVDEVVGGKDKKKKKVKKVMDEWKAGTLKSSSGDKVTDQKQAIAIALNESGQSKEKAVEPKIEKAEKEVLHGGLADKMSLEQIAKKHKVDIEDLAKQYKAGLKVESEHSDDEEKAGEIVKDHLVEDASYYNKLKTIEKADFSEFEKARALGHLVAKKVQIKGKTGQIHYAIRWVNPATGESEKFADVKEAEKVEGQTFEDAVAAIASGSMKKNEKVYSLINMGIYDPKVLTLLTGETYPQRYIKQADINLKELPDQSEIIKDEIRKEQANNDTPDDRVENKLLMRNPEDVELLWAKYRLNVKTVLKGNHKLCIAYGTGGVGKTFNAMKVIENYVPEGDEADFKLRRFNKEIQPDRDQYDYVVVKGRISTVQVYAEMYRHRDKIIVFDDCDSFMANPDVQGFLKGGLDTSKDCEISNLTGRKIYNIQGDDTSGEIPDTFKFKGGVVAITNLQLGDFKEKAVITRSLLNNLAMSVDETLRMIEGFKDTMEVYSADKAKVIPVSQENRDLAFSMLTEQKDKLSSEDVNGRMYSNMALQAQEAEDEGLDRVTVRKMTQLYIDSVSNSFTKQMREQKIQQQQSKSK